MRNWFPFTDYDFYGYLASGFVLLFAADYVLVEETLMLRQDWAFVEIVLVVELIASYSRGTSRPQAGRNYWNTKAFEMSLQASPCFSRLTTVAIMASVRTCSMANANLSTS